MIYLVEKFILFISFFARKVPVGPAILKLIQTDFFTMFDRSLLRPHILN